MPGTRKLVWKAVTIGAGAGAMLVTRQVLKLAWGATSDSDPPGDPADRRRPVVEVLIWTLAISVGAGIARFIALRSAAAVWERATGEAPPVDA